MIDSVIYLTECLFPEGRGGEFFFLVCFWLLLVVVAAVTSVSSGTTALALTTTTFSNSMASSTEPRSVSYLDPTILEQLQLPLQIQQNQGRAKGGEDKSNDEDIPSFILQNQGDDASSKQSKNGLDAMNKRSPNIRSIQDLAVYAVACDEYFMWKKTTNNETAEDSTTSSDIDQVLYQLAASDHNHSVVATLFATNRLESAVRAATGYSRGKVGFILCSHRIKNSHSHKYLTYMLASDLYIYMP